MVILVGVVRNTGATSIEFDERSCATHKDEVLAVAAWPKVVLGPGVNLPSFMSLSDAPPMRPPRSGRRC
jgi:conjugal transfer pilus assembly protein TraK